MGNANERLFSPPTPSQIKGMYWARSMPAIPSVVATVTVMQHIVRSKRRRSRTISRVLLLMSCMDFVFAVCAIFGGLAVPKGAYPDFILPYARGTWTTCEVSGFMLQLSSTSSVLCNGSLTCCYLLTLRYNWSDRRLKTIEPYLLAVPFIVGISMCSVALARNLYNPVPFGCRIQEYPENCLDTGNCIRGDNADNYMLSLFFSWVWSVFAFMCIAMTLIYLKIYKTETRSMRYSMKHHQPSSMLSGEQFTSPPSPLNTVHANQKDTEAMTDAAVTTITTTTTATTTTMRNRHRQTTATTTTFASRFANQSIFYCIVFFLTWIWGTLHVTVNEREGDPPSFLPLLYLLCIFESLQGFNNALVYFRPRYLSYRRKIAEEKERQERRASHSPSSNNSNSGLFLPAIRHAFSVTDEGNEDPDDPPSLEDTHRSDVSKLSTSNFDIHGNNNNNNSNIISEDENQDIIGSSGSSKGSNVPDVDEVEMQDADRGI
eukprot:CAMPEP_0113452398 /NCGR_PEP_ID=MMETSP0014_2-20120614/6826_1 /TAXON_ID=2857 /ORGANISM="Nitzschia sp." /LENGTH=487 /DNA_ID=CAMNT_0000343769 /DNA_START=88 /DNA_END=1551 /DNA_ORIENTATION=+ /assembly_acc=CAM_ASM_000159